MPMGKRDDDKHVSTSYSRHRGDYVYDVGLYERPAPGVDGRFYAQVLNMVRLESGQTVAVNAEFQDALGGTPDEAFSKLEAAVEKWVKDQVPDEPPFAR
jgi:hypothetical protein